MLWIVVVVGLRCVWLEFTSDGKVFVRHVAAWWESLNSLFKKKNQPIA